MQNIKGVILCGGPGKRLRPITYYFQKGMIPVGKSQKPLLEYVVRFLKFYGVEDLAFLVDYKAEQITNYFDDGARFNVNITYVYDDPKSKGTAGSIFNAYKKKAISTSDTLLVYYGDILTNMNLKDFLKFHKKMKATATVALATGFTVRVGVADLDSSGKIIGFQEKPKLEKPVSIAVVALEGKIMADMEHLMGEKQELDLMGDVIPYLMKNGNNVYGYVTDAFWYDVGSTEAYEKLEPDLVDNMLSFCINDKPRNPRSHHQLLGQK